MEEQGEQEDGRIAVQTEEQTDRQTAGSDRGTDRQTAIQVGHVRSGDQATLKLLGLLEVSVGQEVR